MTHEDGPNIKTPEAVDDPKADTPEVIDAPTPPHPAGREFAPDQYESYDNYLYRIRAHHTNAEIALRAKGTEKNELSKEP